jgi:hypothetical protein
VDEALRCKAEVSSFEPRKGTAILSFCLILPEALGPDVLQASKGNEYQRQKTEMFVASRVRPMSKADSLFAICGPLNFSQPNCPPRPITGIAFLLLFLPLLLLLCQYIKPNINLTAAVIVMFIGS